MAESWKNGGNSAELTGKDLKILYLVFVALFVKLLHCRLHQSTFG